MIHINLLPYRTIQKKDNVLQQVVIFIFIIALVTGGTIGYHRFLNNKVSTLDRKVELTKKELKKYQKINKRIKAIKKKLNLLKKKTKVIKGLEADRKKPIKLLETMTRMVVPNRMWLKNLTSKGRKVNIKGNALDEQTVADFMTRIEDSKFFSGVTLISLKQAKIRGLNMKKFSITCKKRVKEKPKKKPVKGKAKK